MRNLNKRGVAVLIVTLLASQSAVVGAGQVTSASSVSTANISNPSISENIIRIQQGSTTSINISLGNEDRGVVEIGDSHKPYHVYVVVQDGNEDGNVHLQLDTRLAGWTTNERIAYSIGNSSDSVLQVTRHSERTAGVIPADKYIIKLYSDNSQVDQSLLIINQSQTGAVEIGTLPKHVVQNLSESKLRTKFTSDQTIAQGDWLVVRGRGSNFYRQVTGDEALPASRMGFAYPSTENERSIHRIRSASFNTTSSLSGYRIDYQINETVTTFNSSQGLTRDDLVVVGLDTDGDGLIEETKTDQITALYATPDNSMYFRFNNSITVPAGATLISQYKISNPSLQTPTTPAIRASDSITFTTYRNITITSSTNLSQNQTHNETETGISEYGPVTVENADIVNEETGTLIYGLAGQGTVGYGLSVQLLATATPEQNAHLLPNELIRATDSENKTAYLLYPTSDLISAPPESNAGTYTISVDHLSESPFIANETAEMHRQVPITVVERKATITVRRSDTAPTNLTISGTTTLAPESKLWVSVQSKGPQILVERKVTVDRNGTWRFTIGNVSTEPVTVMVSVSEQTPQNDSVYLANETVSVSG